VVLMLGSLLLTLHFLGPGSDAPEKADLLQAPSGAAAP
jgi:hypothetical protein